MKKPRPRSVLLAAVALLALVQLVPLSHTNPPVEAEVTAPDEVKAVLRKACYDCHSNETVWGWHTHIAPASFLVAHDVTEGRRHLNFSRWGRMDPKHEAILPQEIAEEVGGGDMPPMLYTVLHPDARLTDAQRAIVVKWAQGLRTAGTQTAQHER